MNMLKLPFVGVRSVLAARAAQLLPVARPGQVESEALFDNMSRSLAGATDRRTALKTALLGVAGILLTKMGIKSAWAATNCLCNGRLYNSNIECCTKVGIVPKNPIADLDQCPNRVPRPSNITCKGNGCGGEGGIPFPDRYFKASFLDQCNTHDCCYGKCNAVKFDCDFAFFEGLLRVCARTYPGVLNIIQLGGCAKMAITYADAVGFYGQGFYEEGQKLSCDCCSTTSCATCAGGSCSSLPACAGGADCVCFTTPQGGGACVHGNTPCAGLLACTSNADCPAGYGCAATTCCGGPPVCAPLCSDLNVPAAGPAARHRTVRKVDGKTVGGR